MPAAKRRTGQASGAGSAIASVSTVVATRPMRVIDGALTAGKPGSRAQIRGCNVHSTAPLR